MELQNFLELIQNQQFSQRLIQIILKNDDLRIKEEGKEKEWKEPVDVPYSLKGYRVKEIDGHREYDILIKVIRKMKTSNRIAYDFMNIVNIQKHEDEMEDFLRHPHLKAIIININSDKENNDHFYSFINAFSKPKNLMVNSEVLLTTINLSYVSKQTDDICGEERMYRLVYDLYQKFYKKPIKRSPDKITFSSKS